MYKPKISIITITYNSGRTIEDTIKSVINQNFENLEYIIIDGGSTDNTLLIIEKYISYIGIVISEPDKGISDAFNKGIKKATGDIIGIINSDDMLADNALSIISSNLDKSVDVLYGNTIIFNDNNKNIHVLKALKDLSHLKYSFGMSHPSTFIAKDAYTKYGVYDTSYKCAMDYDLLLKFYLNGAKFKHINENLTFFRSGGTNEKLRRDTILEVRKSSISNGGNKFVAYIISYSKIFKDILRPILAKCNIHFFNKRVEKVNEDIRFNETRRFL